VRDSELLQAARPALLWNTWESNPQSLASIPWASATLAVKDSEMLQGIRLAVVCKI